jgi:hypothetical protein
MAIHSYSRFGFSGHAGTAITTSYASFACSTSADASMTQAVAFPNSCRVVSIEITGVDKVGGSAVASVTAYLARDAAGKYPLTNAATYTFPTLASAAADNGYIINVETDVHYSADSVLGTVYVIALVDADELTAATTRIRVNWRA